VQRRVCCRRTGLARYPDLHANQHADSCTADEYRDAHAGAHLDSAHSYGYRHSHTQCDGNGFSDADLVADTDHVAHTDANSDTAADYADQHTNTHVQPDLHQHTAQG
jgi:hypothetical protein